MIVIAWCSRIFVLWILIAIATNNAFPQAKQSRDCTFPQYRQFDFWLGDWEVYEADATTPTAYVRVDHILDGCVLRERYFDTSGSAGESFTIYDTGRKLWHQTWVTNHGRLLTIEGGPKDGGMLLTGAYYVDNGHEVRVRGDWQPMPNGVRESAVTSDDGGKTWKPWFDLSFRQHTTADDAITADDASTVARLDDRFQAAVKANEADVMDKILADNFVLVTGSGKVFNKEESLQEARSCSSVYEHQEDSERTVRVWGDTAVITAKLWVKGSHDGKLMDYTLWFSDTYVRTPVGWRYVFGQASLPLPKDH